MLTFFAPFHFLSALLLLELIGIFLVLAVPLSGVVGGQGFSMVVIVILTISACEASLGLAVVVHMIRCYGNDLLGSSLLRCY